MDEAEGVSVVTALRKGSTGSTYRIHSLPLMEVPFDPVKSTFLSPKWFHDGHTRTAVERR